MKKLITIILVLSLWGMFVLPAYATETSSDKQIKVKPYPYSEEEREWVHFGLVKSGVKYVLDKNYQAAENNQKFWEFLDSLLKKIDSAQNAGQVADSLATGIAEYMGMSLDDYYKALDSALATVDRYPHGLIGEIAIDLAIIRAIAVGRVMTAEDISANIIHVVGYAQEIEEMITCCPAHHDEE